MSDTHNLKEKKLLKNKQLLQKHYENSDKKHLFLTELKIFFCKLFGWSGIEKIKSNELDMWVTKMCKPTFMSYHQGAPGYL